MLLVSMGCKPAAIPAVLSKAVEGAIVASTHTKNTVDEVGAHYGDFEISRNKVVATVTTCLVPCELCSGSYLDTIIECYIIRCSCLCHTTRKLYQMSDIHTLKQGGDGRADRAKTLSISTTRRIDIHHINNRASYPNQSIIAEETRHDEYSV